MKFIIALLTLMSFQFSFANSPAVTNCTDYKQYKDVSMAEMKEMTAKSSATIIDVNSKASFEEGHIPGAIHFQTAQNDLANKLPKDKNAPIVAYCGGKSCTAWQKAAKTACEMGYKNIRHFSEGIKGWNSKKS